MDPEPVVGKWEQTQWSAHDRQTADVKGRKYDAKTYGSLLDDGEAVQLVILRGALIRIKAISSSPSANGGELSESSSCRTRGMRVTAFRGACGAARIGRMQGYLLLRHCILNGGEKAELSAASFSAQSGPTKRERWRGSRPRGAVGGKVFHKGENRG